MTESSDNIRLKKRAYHHGNLRAAVMIAALKLVAKRGPSGFTLAEAAKMAGVVPSALYRHFADRETLLAAIALEGFEALIANLQSALKASENDPRESLVSFGIEYFRFASHQPAHFQVMFGAEIEKGKYPDLLDAACRTLDLLTQITQKLDPNWKDLAATTWAMIHGTSLLALDRSFERTDLCRQPETLLKNSLFALAASMKIQPV
ncbi:MAG: TetR/AcrR family transcriptional regulator [Limisphaerales bacterium]